MYQQNDSLTNLLWVIVIIIIFFVFLLIFKLLPFWSNFYSELKKLNCAIRQTDGDEQLYWKKRRKKLWFSLFKFMIN